MEFQTLFHPFPRIKVILSKESETVPDMSFTPREIIQKFSRGEKVPLGFNGQYDSEDDPWDDRNKHYFTDDPELAQEDPTRDPNFDFGDYVEETHALKERQRQARAAQKGKVVQQSQRKASDDELSASDARNRETTSGDGAQPSHALAKD